MANVLFKGNSLLPSPVPLLPPSHFLIVSIKMHNMWVGYIISRCAHIFRSMLNCVNSLEPQSMNSGIEHAKLMISEEKTQHDSRKSQHFLNILVHSPNVASQTMISLYFWFDSILVSNNLLDFRVAHVYFCLPRFIWFLFVYQRCKCVSIVCVCFF